ncbi:hypothetical protein AVEN_97985-1 [Araneus ventricosus]|uniref:Uncharacterized protein n=1 Tax=Araneus ventricosus TaxID=182803 RepID=A0A4Y2IWN5_ARAVE|nr:hypothetical protein AVEN_97985-1 [Araneus ventricosus]
MNPSIYLQQSSPSPRNLIIPPTDRTTNKFHTINKIYQLPSEHHKTLRTILQGHTPPGPEKAKNTYTRRSNEKREKKERKRKRSRKEIDRDNPFLGKIVHPLFFISSNNHYSSGCLSLDGSHHCATTPSACDPFPFSSVTCSVILNKPLFFFLFSLIFLPMNSGWH